MPVHFDRKRMDAVIERYEQWWRGKLDRPLVKGMVINAYPPSHTSLAPMLSQSNCHDFSWSVEQIIDAADSQLSTCEFIGDGYPHMNFDCFGPGVLAAFCGAKLDNSTGQVWFQPCEHDVCKFHLSYDPDNLWSRRIKDLYRAGLERWNGAVIMGMPDLGGVLDVLASLCGTENLIYAMVDEPDEAHRLLDEIQTAWYAAFDDFAAVLNPQGAYTGWNGLLSKDPSYIIQCDFSCMLGPDMFEEFVLETLRKDTHRLHNNLDGVGALKHLDQILSLPDLKAVQWVYGVGQPGPRAWLDVYQKILSAGKQIMIIDNALDNGFEKLRSRLGPSPYTCLTANRQTLSAAMALLEPL